MNNKQVPRINIWLIAGLLILGCVFPSVAAPATIQAPISQSADQLGTSIVQTAEAAQTKTALVLPTATLTPTITFTSTITPTSTPTFIFFMSTATLVPSETSIVPVSSGAGSGNSGKDENSVFTGKEWTCRVTAKYPGRGAVIQKELTIIAYWTLMNTGTKTWTNNGVDFRYTGGYRMDGRKIQDLPFTVAPGNEITLKIQLTTPKTPGTYNTYWTLKVGRRIFCGMKITFDVVD